MSDHCWIMGMITMPPFVGKEGSARVTDFHRFSRRVGQSFEARFVFDTGGMFSLRKRGEPHPERLERRDGSVVPGSPYAYHWWGDRKFFVAVVEEFNRSQQQRIEANRTKIAELRASGWPV